MTSSQLRTCLLTSMVMRSPLSFLMSSVALGELSVIARPSSLQSPVFFPNLTWRWARRKQPANSHVSAPS